MKPVYPTNGNFIVCEDIRQEVGNKISLMGVFSSGKIVFSSQAESLSSPLALYLNLVDGEGAFKTRFEIENPAGEINIEQEQEDAAFIKNNSYNIIIKFNTLDFKHEGKYIFRVFLDEKKYENYFFIEKSALSETS